MLKKVKQHRLAKGFIFLLCLSNVIGIMHAQEIKNSKNQTVYNISKDGTIYDKYGRPIGRKKPDGTITDKHGRPIARIQNQVITDKHGRPKARINSSTITDKHGRIIATKDSKEVRINNKTKYRKQ